MTQERQTGLTIIIPCLNEEKTIGDCVRQGVEALRKYGIPGEILVADNGSTDNSAAAAEEAGARVIREPERGYGAAYSSGIRNAAFEYCIKADADGSYDLNEINAFWEKLREGKWDIILGSRFKGKIMPGAMPFLHRYLGTPALTLLINLIYKSSLSDINSGMRAFPTRVLLGLNLTCKGMEFASEMLVKALKKNLKILEIPITLHKDKRDRKPHLKSFRDGWRHLRFIILMSPFQLFFYPGAASVCLGLFLSALLLAPDYFPGNSHVSPGVASIFGITSFACVQNFVILGEVLIIFSYISKLNLIQNNIDIPNSFIEKLKKTLSLNKLLVISCAGLALNVLWMIQIAANLYSSFTAGIFSPIYTKLGILNFTIFISSVMLFFTSFFISGINPD